MIASEVMTREPTAIRADARVRDAIETLRAMEVRHLPVVNEDDGLVGMLSDRDFGGPRLPTLGEIELLGPSRLALDGAVSEIMTAGVVSVEEDTDVREIADLLIENKIGAVPVVNQEGRLVGIVSYIDILREIPRFVA